MLGGGVDAATLVAALGAGPPPPECRWSEEITAIVDDPSFSSDARGSDHPTLLGHNERRCVCVCVCVCVAILHIIQFTPHKLSA